MHSIARVLLAGGDEPRLAALHQLLESAGHTVVRSGGTEDAARRIGAGEADVVLLAHDALGSLGRLIEAQCGGGTTSFVALASAQARSTLPGAVAEVVDPASGEAALVAAVERAARDGEL